MRNLLYSTRLKGRKNEQLSDKYPRKLLCTGYILIGVDAFDALITSTVMPWDALVP
jgi:hypothetical protein